MTTGTKEWAASNVNIQLGCEHGCLYCYAKNMMVNRFGKCTAEEWADPVIDQKKVDKQYRKRKNQPIMFPSSHDITRRNRAECLIVLKKLIEAGNQVLIVSKPSVCCITLLCNFFKDYKDQIMFRFTIGSVNDDVLSFWEPNAPSFNERLNCLKYAYEHGYQTSVSCEPYLDVYPIYTYLACKDYITDSFWIGRLRGFNSRIDYSDVTPEQRKKFVEPLAEAQSYWFVKTLHRLLDGQPYIKWKDSIIVTGKVRYRLCKGIKTYRGDDSVRFL